MVNIHSEPLQCIDEFEDLFSQLALNLQNYQCRTGNQHRNTLYSSDYARYAAEDLTGLLVGLRGLFRHDIAVRLAVRHTNNARSTLPPAPLTALISIDKNHPVTRKGVHAVYLGYSPPGSLYLCLE